MFFIVHSAFMIIMIIYLIYIAQFDTSGILTVLYIVIQYIETQYMHIWTYIKHMTHIRVYTYVQIHMSASFLPESRFFVDVWQTTWFISIDKTGFFFLSV